jgi:hypothetical protein
VGSTVLAPYTAAKSRDQTHSQKYARALKFPPLLSLMHCEYCQPGYPSSRIARNEASNISDMLGIDCAVQGCIVKLRCPFFCGIDAL